MDRARATDARAAQIHRLAARARDGTGSLEFQGRAKLHIDRQAADGASAANSCGR